MAAKKSNELKLATIGSLAKILNELPGPVQVFAHEAEKPYINGEKTPLKLAKLEKEYDLLHDDMKARYHQLKAGFQNSHVPVDQTLHDGEKLPYCDGIEVIHTPGHTVGHICLYLKASKVLIAGDALAVQNGMLVKGPGQYNYNQAQADQSLEKLKKYDIKAVICFHGGLYREDVNKRIAELQPGR